jgi:hypothetical protein
MDHRIALKGMLISFLIDRERRDNKGFDVVVAHSVKKLYFIDLLKFESTNHLGVTQHPAPIIQQLNTYSIRVTCIVTDNASNLVRAHKNGSAFVLGRVLHVRWGCHSANLALEDFGREEAALLAFQNEMRLMFQN